MNIKSEKLALHGSHVVFVCICNFNIYHVLDYWLQKNMTKLDKTIDAHQSGQIIIFHQPDFPEIFGEFPKPQLPKLGVRSLVWGHELIWLDQYQCRMPWISCYLPRSSSSLAYMAIPSRERLHQRRRETPNELGPESFDGTFRWSKGFLRGFFLQFSIRNRSKNNSGQKKTQHHHALFIVNVSYTVTSLYRMDVHSSHMALSGVLRTKTSKLLIVGYSGTG